MPGEVQSRLHQADHESPYGFFDCIHIVLSLVGRPFRHCVGVGFAVEAGQGSSSYLSQFCGGAPPE